MTTAQSISGTRVDVAVTGGVGVVVAGIAVGVRVEVEVEVAVGSVGLAVAVFAATDVGEGVPMTNAVAVAATTAVEVTSRMVPVSLETYNSLMGTVQATETV